VAGRGSGALLHPVGGTAGHVRPVRSWGLRLRVAVDGGVAPDPEPDPEEDSDEELAETGASLLGPNSWALALILLGAAFLWTARRSTRWT